MNTILLDGSTGLPIPVGPPSLPTGSLSLPLDAVATYRVLPGTTGDQDLGAAIFSGAPSLGQAIIRSDLLAEGAQYRVEVRVSSATEDWAVPAAVVVETNAPPSSGHLEAIHQGAIGSGASPVSVGLLSQTAEDGL